MKAELSMEKLIVHYLLGNITESEKEQLDRWIKSSPQNEEFFNRMCTSTDFHKRYEAYTKINSHHDAWKRFQESRSRTSRIRVATILKYAAILTFPILLIAAGWYFYSPVPEQQTSEEQALGDSIQPGIQGATLTVAGETKQSIVSTQAKPIPVSQSTTALVQNGRLVYPPSHMDADSEEPGKGKVTESNSLTTDQGNEFNVTFEDGTTVHLNYDTEIRYPVKFSKTERVVYLRGEAYFKIAKDARPFCVITNQGIIKQYGTEFNVNTFTPQRTEVALVKGSISITQKDNKREHFVKPGQVAYVDTQKENVDIHNTDLTPYIAWNDGRLIFEDRTLENIADILERWYKVNITFGSPELKQLHFTGNMDKYGSIAPILKAIARTTNLNIYIDEREILITN